MMRIKIQIEASVVVALLAVASPVAAANDLRIVDAARTRDAAAVKMLLKQGAAVNTSQLDGATALHWAAQRNDLDMVDVLIRAGAQVNAATHYGVTPLALACTNANAPMVDRLLKAGANAKATQMSGETVLMTCSRTGVVEATTLLLSNAADVNAKENALAQTALMWAAEEGHTDMVRTLLAHGADIHARSSTGYTAFILTAREGYLDTAKALLAAGADVNEASKDGTTALLIATIRAQLTYAKALLDIGANPNLGPGFNPLHWAAGKWDSQLADASNGILSADTEWSAFGGLTGTEKLPFVKLLLAHGADPNAKARRNPGIGIQVKGAGGSVAGGTAFLIAARANDVAVMKELIAHGADPKVATTNGTTPLMMAAGVGHNPGVTRSIEAEALEAVKVCVELGNDVNAANSSGDTALHGAAWKERADSIVQYLVDHGANMNAKNKRKWTPLVIAEGIRTTGNYIHSETTTALLRKLGAEPSPPDINREPSLDSEP